jgi:hypothetical protein
VIQVFDPVIHEPMDDETPSDEEDTQDAVTLPPAYDARFVKIKRPLVIVGGELTLDQLELQWDALRRLSGPAADEGKLRHLRH